MPETPRHLRADACYVCGGAPHPGSPGMLHDYWSNADAKAHFAAEDKGRTFRYSNGTTTPEANYVATYRPY